MAGAAAAAAAPAPGPAPAPGQNSMAPVDQGYGSYPAHGPMYASPANVGPAQTGGGYASAYGANYGY